MLQCNMGLKKPIKVSLVLLFLLATALFVMIDPYRDIDRDMEDTEKDYADQVIQVTGERFREEVESENHTDKINKFMESIN